MNFDLFLDGPFNVDAVSRVPVTLRCTTCLRHSAVQIWNRRWNGLACLHCRRIAKQFTNVCAATVDPITRHIGHISIKQILMDWRPYGLMAMCLGFDHHRRILVYLQLQSSGLKGQTIRVDCVARKPQSDETVWRLEAIHQLCRCSAAACKHNRIVRWLPPTRIWDQDQLIGDFRISNARGDLYFEDKIQLNIAPPQLGQTLAVRDEAELESAEAMHE